MVINKQNFINQNHIKINNLELEQGIYFFEIKIGNQSKIQKICVQR